MVRGSWFPVRGRHDRQRSQSGDEEAQVNYCLCARFAKSVERVRVSVTPDQEGLKKEQAGSPYAGSAAEPGKEILADQWLDLEQKESAKKNGEGEDRHPFYGVAGSLQKRESKKERERWSNGVVEWWESRLVASITPSLHYSITAPL